MTDTGQASPEKPVPPKGMNPRDVQFCEAFVLGGEVGGISTVGNGTRSYMISHPKASEKTARTMAARALAKTGISLYIASLIEYRSALAAHEVKATPSLILNTLANLAFSDITKVIAGDYRSIYEMHRAIEKQSPEVTSAIQELEIREYLREDGEGGNIKLKIKLKDSIQPLKMLTAYFGMDNTFYYAMRILKQHGIAMIEDSEAPTGFRLEVHENQ